MIKKIDHIGIVVRKIDPMLSILERAFGAREIFRKEFSEHNHVSTLVRIGEDCLEHMEPTSPGGAAVVDRMKDCIRRRGENISHLKLKRLSILTQAYWSRQL